MLKTHLLLAVVWIVYCFLHSFLLLPAVKIFFQKLLGKQAGYYRLLYNLFSLIGLAAIVYMQVNTQTILIFQPTSWLRIVGGLVAAAGLILMIICIRKYFFTLSGLASLLKEPADGLLMTGGIHRFVRHPLYLGTFLFIWGLLLFAPYLSLLLSNSIITIYTLIGIELEEKKLVKQFGEAYIRYRRQVPGLLPSGPKGKKAPLHR